MADLQKLPGTDLVTRGIHDLESGHQTACACLVASAAQRLVDLKIMKSNSIKMERPELTMYGLLLTQYPQDAYSRYNSMRRRLASFIHALEHDQGRELRSKAR
jgi:hypothetical protein